MLTYIYFFDTIKRLKQFNLDGISMTTKLLERLVTKFSIKVADLIRYLEISKATIYNYRNLDKFSDIPKDKQLKILYLFGKESEEELELVLYESDAEILNKYLNRISSILAGNAGGKKEEIASMEELSLQNERLLKENASLQRQLVALKDFSGLDELSRTVILDKVARIVSGATNAELKEFVDYLNIFEAYKSLNGR